MIRRGLSLVELMLSITITMMVAAAIAAMLGAVSSGVGARRDNRTTMVLANAAQARLSAYAAPARCVLDAGPGGVVLWLDDSRASGTVHATEVRWLLHDAANGCLDVFWVNFPDTWGQAAQDLEDREYPVATDWLAVLAAYQAKGLVSGQTLVESLASMDVAMDQADPIDARHVLLTIEFDTPSDPLPVAITGTIRAHQPPTS